MAGTQNHGFDVVYEISTDRFLDMLHDLFIDSLPLRLLNLPLSASQTVGGVQVVQTGSFSLPSTPSVTLAINPPNGFVLTLTFTGSTLALNPVLSALGATLIPALAPTNVGNTVITLPLGIDTSTQSNRSPITISRTAGAINVLPPDNLAGAVSAAVANAVRIPLQNAVATALQQAFPIVKDIQLPAQGPCNVFPRFMKMKFLSGGPAPNALGFFLALEQGTLNGGDATTVAAAVNAFTSSALAAGTDAVLTVANLLLLDLACCLLPQSGALSGLTGNPERVQDPSETCCRWSNLGPITIGTTAFDSAPLFEICIKNGGLSVDGHVKQSGFGWHADITFSLMITLENDGGLITPRLGTPVVTVDAQIEWWVWLLALVPVIVGAVVGFLIGGPAGSAVGGALVGALIGALISAPIVIVLAAFQGLLNTTLSGSLGALTGALSSLALLPTDLVSLIGGLDLIGNPIVDDIRVQGRIIRPPALALQPSWTYVRGPIVPDASGALLAIKLGGNGGGPTVTEYQRAATGIFVAIPRSLREPVHYQWQWSGANISGQGTLPGTTATFNIAGNVCHVQTAMGGDLSGAMVVAATDAMGKTATASSRVAIRGIETHINVAHLPAVLHSAQSIQNQLVDAVSHGMGVSRKSVLLH